mmetsp:Transcript_12864/g.39481  ORF Transcript_12864/g.39481 Transcript_12864/m.39481 type:complete len:137 (-) Transcript_12864:22-432(-)
MLRACGWRRQLNGSCARGSSPTSFCCATTRRRCPPSRPSCAAHESNVAALLFTGLICAQVVRSRDASSISGPLVLVNAGNGLLWTVYGAAVEDALVWAPNLAGVALAAAQLALKLAFRGARASTTAVAATAAKGVT